MIPVALEKTGFNVFSKDPGVVNTTAHNTADAGNVLKILSYPVPVGGSQQP